MFDFVVVTPDPPLVVVGAEVVVVPELSQHLFVLYVELPMNTLTTVLIKGNLP